MSNPPAPPSQQRTIESMLDATGRDACPIRKVFVQPIEGHGAAPLADLVVNHDGRALDLYLLHHAKASGGDFEVTLGAAVWARALGLSSSPNGKTAVSKAWKRLEDMQLISRGRVGRTARVVLLHEDGKGAEYTRPVSKDDGLWLNLPHAYWLDRWYLTLDLPAKAMLLIALSLYNDFYLPFEKSKDWYGISRKTAQVGVKSLVDHGLLDRMTKWVEEPLSDIGHRQEIRYTLQPPFGPLTGRDTSTRAAAGKRAASRRKATRKATDPPKPADKQKAPSKRVSAPAKKLPAASKKTSATAKKDVPVPGAGRRRVKGVMPPT